LGNLKTGTSRHLQLPNYPITKLQNQLQALASAVALKTNPLPPKMGKEAQEVLEFSAHPESHVSPVFRVESWHLAARIDDPGPVAVASQGSSLSHSA
jgi:hypothetical protein